LISRKPFWFNNVKPSIAEPAELSTPTAVACLSLRPLLCYGSIKQPSNKLHPIKTALEESFIIQLASKTTVLSNNRQANLKDRTLYVLHLELNCIRLKI
jgi:hypothetical protein